MLSRMCTSRSAFSVSQTLKSPVSVKYVPKNYVVRNYARETRSRVATRSRPTVWERLMAPASPNGKSCYLNIKQCNKQYNFGKGLWHLLIPTVSQFNMFIQM